MTKLTTLAGLVLLVSACATHNGMISSSHVNENFIYEDIAFGVAESNLIFGIGGLSKDALILEAKRELMKNRPLQSDEEYINFTVDFKRSFWPFYSKNKVTMSADVIRYSADSGMDPFSEIYKMKLSSRNLSNELFNVGDSILFKKDQEGKIISFVDDNTVRIQFVSHNDKIRTKKISIFDVYSTTKSYKENNIDGHYSFSVRAKNNKSINANGTIIGIGLKSILVKDRSDNIHVIKVEP